MTFSVTAELTAATVTHATKLKSGHTSLQSVKSQRRFDRSRGGEGVKRTSFILEGNQWVELHSRLELDN